MKASIIDESITRKVIHRRNQLFNYYWNLPYAISLIKFTVFLKILKKQMLSLAEFGLAFSVVF